VKIFLEALQMAGIVLPVIFLLIPPARKGSDQSHGQDDVPSIDQIKKRRVISIIVMVFFLIFFLLKQINIISPDWPLPSPTPI